MSITTSPTISPSAIPSGVPSSSIIPSLYPAAHPSTQPAITISGVPSTIPSDLLSAVPSSVSSQPPSVAISSKPSLDSSTFPSPFLSAGPSLSSLTSSAPVTAPSAEVQRISSSPSSITPKAPAVREPMDYFVFLAIAGSFALLFMYVLCSKLRAEMKGRRDRLAIAYYGSNHDSESIRVAGTGQLEGRLLSIRDANRSRDDNFEDDVENGDGETLRQIRARSFVGIEGGLIPDIEEEKSEIRRETAEQLQPSNSIKDFMNDDGLLDLGGELPPSYNKTNISSSGPSSSAGAKSATDYSSEIGYDLSLDEFPDNTTGVSLATSTGHDTAREVITMNETKEEMVNETLSDSVGDNIKSNRSENSEDSNANNFRSATEDDNEQEKNDDDANKL